MSGPLMASSTGYSVNGSITTTTSTTSTGLKNEANNNKFYGENDVVCNCATFLDPFPNQITWRSVSNLQHYCRVCNTQLNSCKQSRIHAEGKKHEKRLAYLKFCFENGANANSSMPITAEQEQVMTPDKAPPTVLPPTATPTTSAPPPPMLSQMYPSYLHYTAPPAAFYFPAQSYHTFPDFVAAVPTGPPPNTPLGMPLGSMSIPFGYNYTNTQVPNQSGQEYTKKPLKAGHRAKESLGHAHGKKMANKTSSSGQGSIASSRTSNSSHVLNCDLCRLTFPSLTVLNNHLKGSRHLRKVKSQVAYKQMKAAGMQFKQCDQGEIQCEVCRVSVNSSHQLQAHLAGHKHKVRCYKRGLDPNAAMITPTSTPPSTAPSECSAPQSSVSSKYNKSSLLGLPPQKLPQATPSNTPLASMKSNNKQPGLLGEHPAAAVAAVNALRGLLPLPLPKPLANVPNKAQIKGQNLVKVKTRKVSRPKTKERRDSTTESDEAAEGECPGNNKKELHNTKEENKTEESSTQSSKGHDFSSDEAKESEGDSDQIDKKNNNKSESNKTNVKYNCDTCNVTVNSTTQLSQHMNSPKHHVKVSDGQPKTTDKKLKEIPMLNMFLKTLQPSYYPASNDQDQEKADESCSSNTEVER